MNAPLLLPMEIGEGATAHREVYQRLREALLAGFHLLIYGASRSELLMAMIEGLWLRVGPFIRLALPRPDHLQHSMACHWTALAALQHRDPAAARAAISNDISGAADDLGRLLADRQAPMGGETIERE